MERTWNLPHNKTFTLPLSQSHFKPLMCEVPLHCLTSRYYLFRGPAGCAAFHFLYVPQTELPLCNGNILSQVLLSLHDWNSVFVCQFSSWQLLQLSGHKGPKMSAFLDDHQCIISLLKLSRCYFWLVKRCIKISLLLNNMPFLLKEKADLLFSLWLMTEAWGPFSTIVIRFHWLVRRSELKSWTLGFVAFSPLDTVASLCCPNAHCLVKTFESWSSLQDAQQEMEHISLIQGQIPDSVGSGKQSITRPHLSFPFGAKPSSSSHSFPLGPPFVPSFHNSWSRKDRTGRTIAAVWKQQLTPRQPLSPVNALSGTTADPAMLWCLAQKTEYHFRDWPVYSVTCQFSLQPICNLQLI